jgi:hypothetical protein
MLWRPTRRLALVAAAVLIPAATGRVEAGSGYRGYHGLGRSSHFHQRFHQARGDLHHRYGRAQSRHLGVRRHQGLGHGAYSCGVRRYHGLGDGYHATRHPSRYWYGYGYDGWITVGAPDYHRTSEPPVFKVVATRRADTAPVQPKPTPSDVAWRRLARGEARAALSDFAVLALRNTRDAEARAGYGLAAAMVGKDDTAMWAFRRAVDINADILGDLTHDDRLPEPLRQLLDDYAGRIQGGDGEPDQDTDRLAANNG